MARRLPPLNWLRSFETAARHLSFTRAAEEMNVTQAAVSQQVKALEGRLGISLFHRVHNRLFLTYAGQAWLPKLRAGFDLLASGTDELHIYVQGASLTVRLPSSFSIQWLVPRLDRFHVRYTADAAIVLEPTNNTVAVSHPGGLYWQVRVPGLQRSPGARWNRGVQDGVSAIEKLPRVIDALIDLERHFHASAGDDPMEEGRAPFSLVIGKVTGGFYETVTAGEAILRGGAYCAPGLGDIAGVMKSFRRAIDDANAADSFLKGHPAGCEFLHHGDSTRQSPQIPLAVQMCGVLQAHGGERGVLPGTFSCDMRHLVSQGGVPSIIFGPGTIAQAHKTDEHIDVREYLECIEHLVEFIWTWCNLDPELPMRSDGTPPAGSGD